MKTSDLILIRLTGGFEPITYLKTLDEVLIVEIDSIDTNKTINEIFKSEKIIKLSQLIENKK